MEEKLMEGMSSDIPREIEELLVDIKYIAGLPPSHKYDLESQGYSHATSLFSRAYRTFFTTEDKTKALDFINKTITTAIQLGRKYSRWQPLICVQLSLLTDAITNMKHVYSTEPKFAGRLDTIEIKIQPAAFNNACLSPTAPTPPRSILFEAPTPAPSPARSAPISFVSIPKSTPIIRPSSTPGLPAPFFMERSLSEEEKEQN